MTAAAFAPVCSATFVSLLPDTSIHTTAITAISSTPTPASAAAMTTGETDGESGCVATGKLPVAGAASSGPSVSSPAGSWVGCNATARFNARAARLDFARTGLLDFVWPGVDDQRRER